MDKTALSESDICDRYITPALERAGWATEQWRREFSFTDGKMIVRGQLVARGKPRRADYLLFYKPNIPIAVIEAKDNRHSVRAGMQRALDYSTRLDVPFVFSSNGDGFVLHDKTGTYPGGPEVLLDLDDFPTPAESGGATRSGAASPTTPSRSSPRRTTARLAARRPATGFVFTRPDGEPIHPDVFSQSWHRLARESGLRRIRLHDLRHIHASILLKAGVPVKVVSERLGHSSPAFTMTVYQHVLPGMQADAARVFGQAIFGE